MCSFYLQRNIKLILFIHIVLGLHDVWNLCYSQPKRSLAYANYL